MKNLLPFLSLALLATPIAVFAQFTAPVPFASSASYPGISDRSGVPDEASSNSQPVYDAAADPGAFGGVQQRVATAIKPQIRPFSRIAVGAGISPLGIGLQAAVNLNRHFDVRGTGNYFNYATSFNTNGFNVDAKLNFASAGASVDYYPFRWGLRLSPGVLFYNQNGATADAPVTPGTSFTLNDQTFYAATPNTAKGITALSGTGSLGLNATKPAFTMTTGIGNLIPRSGRHWAIPFEIGAAFTGSPKVNMSLTGWACYDQAQTLCTNVADPTNPIAVQIQGDLQTQLAKWRNDLDPLKVYPIVSTGVVFNFGFRRAY